VAGAQASDNGASGRSFLQQASPNAVQQYIIQRTMPIWIVAATTPNASAARNPLFPPSVMTPTSALRWMLRTWLVAMCATGWLACTETTAPARQYAVLEDVGASDWRSVSVGSEHTCALKANGAAFCWGSNQAGQLGVARVDTVCGPVKTQVRCSMVPVQAQPGTTFLSISTGARHTCGITIARDALCWGANDFGELSEFGIAGPTATRIPGTLGWAQISAGSTHTCAVRTDGALFCWGANERGQLGNGIVVTSGGTVRVSMPAPVASVTAGQSRTCARTTLGTVYCWGAIWTARESGLELTRAQSTPQLVPSAPSMSWVSVGTFTTCGAAVSGVAYCWEANPRGEMGTGTQDGSTTPRPVSGDIGFVHLSAGIVNSCGVAISGAGYCWGDDSFGQLGVSPSTLIERCGDQQLACSTTPVPVFGRQKFTEISAGFGSHACGVTTKGNLYCWGLGVSGQRGDGSSNFAISIPIQVAAPKGT
jgi:alpha-tubulin suppressor-like RCC1 family protein